MAQDDSPHETLAERMVRLQVKAERNLNAAADGAAKAGYIRAVTDQMASSWSVIEAESGSDSSLVQWVASGHAIAGELERSLDAIWHCAQSASHAVERALPIFSTASANSVAISSSLTLAPRFIFQPCPFLEDSSEELYARKLALLDPSLGDTYRAAWSNNYDQRHDLGRAALFGMRQVFDHFFDLLSPTVAVRASFHWTAKPTPPFDAVHRLERLTFAAYRWIGPDERTTLLESAKNLLDAYGRLNAAHVRSALDVDKARDAFRGVDAIIRRWVDGIEPWPPAIEPVNDLENR